MSISSIFFLRFSEIQHWSYQQQPFTLRQQVQCSCYFVKCMASAFMVLRFQIKIETLKVVIMKVSQDEAGRLKLHTG